eukprot:CAMPEP_0181371928 /NCGR_PEP_ID=MMETSP1106-20121128/14409_1 /TAXON_ID=81844 /ORGANISM="Mantoniella antarctica, Strain SL-175" /LENGTH=344 /DNA_ID=CAMNT_0023489197 /DNA_START=13 /DNA_END=1045 /DNA_ORIENTATION=-
MCVRASAGPGAVIPAGACVGPCSSTLELRASSPDQSHLARTRQPEVPLTWRLLIGWPIVVVVHVASLVPWLLVVWFLVAPVLREVVEEDTWDGASRNMPSLVAGGDNGGLSPPPSPPSHLWHSPPPRHHLNAIRRRTWHGTVRWFMVPRRLALYFMLRVMQRVFVPWVSHRRGGGEAARGRAVHGDDSSGPANCVGADPAVDHAHPAATSNLCGVLPLVGTHYETISCVFRALGARVGARVFWPGSGVYVADGAFDLLEVGNDAVWGSRTLLFPANALHALPIKIAPGANVADRCVVLAGVTVEAEATLGSGSLAAEGFTFPEGSVWVGARDGNAVLLERGMEE